MSRRTMQNEQDERAIARDALIADAEEQNAKQLAVTLQRENNKLQKELEAQKARDAVQLRIAVALEEMVIAIGITRKLIEEIKKNSMFC